VKTYLLAEKEQAFCSALVGSDSAATLRAQVM